MNQTIVAVGQRVPTWAQQAWQDYAERFPPDWRLDLKTIKTEPRGARTVEQLWTFEAARIESALPKGALRIGLDERGERWTTQDLSQRMSVWHDEGTHVAWIIGGPDGLAPQFRSPQVPTLRLSDMTLPINWSESY